MTEQKAHNDVGVVEMFGWVFDLDQLCRLSLHTSVAGHGVHCRLKNGETFESRTFSSRSEAETHLKKIKSYWILMKQAQRAAEHRLRMELVAEAKGREGHVEGLVP